MPLRRKINWLRLAAAGLITLGIAACSGGSGGDTPVSTSSTNRAPVAASDTVQANGGSLSIAVLGNDVDPDGDSLQLILVGTPAHGTTTINDAGTPANGSDDFVVYIPTPNYTGADQFSYTVGDDTDGRASGEVNVVAMATTDARDKVVATPMGTAVSISVLDTASVNISSMTAPAFGSVTINQAGTPADPSDDFLVYTPVAGYTGLDTFYYTLTGPDGTDTAAVTVEITGTPSLPATPNVRGQVMKGPVNEARVEVFEMGADGQRFGVPIAATTTDDNGRWALTLPTARQNLLVKASGGSYADETRSAPGRTLLLDDAPGILAVLPASEDFVVSSIYTHALYLRALHASDGSNFDSEYTQLRADSVNAWGFDISADASTNPAAPDPVMPLIAHKHAMALGGAANALDRIVTALGMGQPNGEAVYALSRDLSDCRLDGNDFDGVITVFAQGLDRPIANNLDLNLEILRFRNNNFSAYAATPLAVWNDLLCTPPSPPPDIMAPTVAVDLQRLNLGSPALSGAIDDPNAVVRVTIAGATYNAINHGNYWRLDTGLISPDLADGIYDVVVVAVDADGNVGTDTSSVDLIIDSLAPVVSIDSMQTTDVSPGLTGTVDDPGATVTVRIDGVDYPAVVAGTNWSLPAGVISPALAEGVYDAVVTAVDSFSNTGMAESAAAVTISVNDPPEFSISGDIVVDEDFVGARLVSVTPNPVAPAELSQEVVYQLTPPAGDFADVTIDPENGNVYITALPNLSGSQSFSIIADDGQSVGNFASQSFTLTINPVNDPPAFVMSGDITANSDFVGVRSVSATPGPVPDDELLQSVVYSLSPASVAFADVSLDPLTGTVDVSSLPGRDGNQVFIVTANDGQSEYNISTASFVLTISESLIENVAPEIDGQQALVTPEEVALLITPADLLITDPDNLFPDDFSLNVQPGANYSLLGNTITPAVNFVGNLVVPVTVSDGVASSELFNLNVAVSPINDPPLFSISGNISENEDFIGSRQVTVTPGPVPADESAQSVIYSLSPPTVSFASVAINSASGTVTVSAIAEQSGSQIFTITADDGQGVNNNATQNFSLSIAGNSDPTSAGIADVTVIEDAADEVIDLFSTFDDVEDADAALNYAVVTNSNPALFDSVIIDSVAGTLTLDFAADTSGAGSITLRVTDSGGDWVEDSFNVTINKEADLSISALTVSDPAPGEGFDVDFTVTVSNAGPSTATGVVVNIPLPAGYSFVNADDLVNYNSTTGNWTVGTLSGSASLLITANVNTAGPYDLTAEITAAGEPDPDSTPGNAIPAEDDQRTVSTSPRPVTDLALSIIVDDPIPAPGATVEFTITVENFGLADATGISVSLPPLPGELTYTSATPSAGGFNLATGLWSGFDIAWSGDPMVPFFATLQVTAEVDAMVPLTTLLLTTADLAAMDQVNSDGAESDTSALLVLGDGQDCDWVGGAGPDPTDWHNDANWGSGLAPTPGDNVVIPPTAFDPVLNADALNIATLDIESGAQLSLNGNRLSTVGDLDARDGPIVGPGVVQLEFGRLRGTIPDLEILTADPSIEVDFHGDTTINGNMTILEGRIDTRANTITINGDLLSTGTGLLVQKDGGSEVLVNGNARFEGGDYTQTVSGKAPLRTGELYVTGNFIQTGDQHSFAAEDKHLVIFNGSVDQTVSFQNPDASNPDPDTPAAFGSRFANLLIDKDANTDGVVRLLSDVVVLQQLQQSELPILPVITAAPGSGFVLSIGGADLDEPVFPMTKNIVFDNVPVEIFQGDSISGLESMVFRNMAPSVVQLSILRRDFGGPEELVDAVFETLPNYAAGGRYLLVENLHPDPNRDLTVEVLSSMPGYGTPMTEVIGNTFVIWGTGTEDSDRDGLIDADEYPLGFNPVFADIDNDGLNDSEELAQGTDAYSADTDGDDIADGAEVAADGDPLSPAAFGTILYVRPAPLGNDANTGFGGWGDALASNAAVAAALIDGAGAGQPFYVLYDAGVYDPLEIDNFSNVSLIGSLGPGISVPAEQPTTIFDATPTPDTAVVRIIDGTSISLQSMLLTGASNFGGGDGSIGGGVYIENSSVNISRMSIEDNVAADAGGGVYADLDSVVSIDKTLIRRNNVPPGGIGGGGLASYGSLQLSNSVIAENRYDGNSFGGGGIYVEPVGATTIKHNKILSNYSAESGGGLMFFTVDAPVSVFNNLIVGNANEAGLGGALFGDKMDRGQLTLIESNTIAFNRSLIDVDSAGGIHIDRTDDVQIRDNVVRFNVDGDLIDELQDQYQDDSAAAFIEYNSIEDFGAPDLNNNDNDNPQFTLGFYLDSDSSVDDTGSQTAAAAGLDFPFTTSVDGAEDVGILDRGFHYLDRADGEANGVILTGQVAECATNTLTMHFAISGVGGDLGAGHVAGVKQHGSDTAGGTLSTLTGIRPYGFPNSQLAVDEGDGVYHVSIVGVSHAGGEIAALEIEIDDDNKFVVNSTDLNLLFAAEGC